MDRSFLFLCVFIGVHHVQELSPSGYAPPTKHVHFNLLGMLPRTFFFFVLFVELATASSSSKENFFFFLGTMELVASSSSLAISSFGDDFFRLGRLKLLVVTSPGSLANFLGKSFLFLTFSQEDRWMFHSIFLWSFLGFLTLSSSQVFHVSPHTPLECYCFLKMPGPVQSVSTFPSSSVSSPVFPVSW